MSKVLSLAQKRRKEMLEDVPKNVNLKWFRDRRNNREEKERKVAYNPGSFLDEIERRLLSGEDPEKLADEYFERDEEFCRQYGDTPYTAMFCAGSVCARVAVNEEEIRRKELAAKKRARTRTK